MAQNMHTEWVECPYCRKVIQAPNEPDVTFYCPDCGRELITYDKEKINEAMEKGHSNDTLFITVADVPREVKKWNWGAFLLNPLWGLFNGVYWPFGVTLAFLFLYIISGFNDVVYVVGGISNFVISIKLGINGSEWAWRAKSWNDVHRFLIVQNNWMVAALIYVFVSLFLFALISAMMVEANPSLI